MHSFELRSLSVLKRSTFLANGSWKEKELNAIRFNRHFPSLVIRDQRHIVQSKIFHQGWFISGMRFCWEANGQKGAGDTQCCSVPQTCGSGEGSSVTVNCDTAVSSNQWKQCGRTLELGIVGPLWSARSVCFVFLVSTLSLAHLNNALKAGILEKIFLATSKWASQIRLCNINLLSKWTSHEKIRLCRISSTYTHMVRQKSFWNKLVILG